MDYGKLVDMIRQEGKAYNGYELLRCTVISVSPLVISYGEGKKSSAVSDIFCPPEMLSLADPAAISTDEAGLKQYLTALYKLFHLKAGDMVFVKRVGNEFYILGKAVKA